MFEIPPKNGLKTPQNTRKSIYLIVRVYGNNKLMLMRPERNHSRQLGTFGLVTLYS